MDVVLHLGAHRTASTSFQGYMRDNASDLLAQGVGFWGPLRTRKGLLSGIIPVGGTVRPQRQLQIARGRVRLALEKAAMNGTRTLIVSDENMMGAPRQNLRDMLLYRSSGMRMARYFEAFEGTISKVAISIRSLDSFWASSMCFALSRGNGLPDAAFLDRLVQQSRSWRDVVTDLACAMPGVEIVVLPYETFGGRQEARLEHMCGGAVEAPMRSARIWLNKGPDLAGLRRILADQGCDPSALPEGEGRYLPFSAAQSAQLRETYADDLFWLMAGADGHATLITEKRQGIDGANPHPATTTRGQEDDVKKGRVA